FPFHDERFHPQNFFRRTKFYRDAQQLAVTSAIEPALVDFAEAVPGTVDQIDHIFAAMCFGEPMRESSFTPVTAVLQCGKRSLDILRLNKKIQVFGVTRDSSVTAKGICSADQERDLRLLERMHRRPIELVAIHQLNPLTNHLSLITG